MQVSVLVITYNEATNLPRFLDSVSWCDDIIAVDSGSTDGTIDILRDNGARVLTRDFDNFANQRNYGLDNGKPKHEWVLHLDADEVVTAAFRARLDALLAETRFDAYRVPSKLILHDHWLRYAGMYPTYQVRLGHRDRLRFKQVGHGQREDLPQSRVGVFEEPYLHYNFSRGLGDWFRRHVRYAEDDADLLLSIREGHRHTDGTERGGDRRTRRRRKLKERSARLPLVLRPVGRFLYTLVWCRGFLDGRYGVIYSLMLGSYEAMVAVFAFEKILRKKMQEGDAGGPVPPGTDQTL